MFADSVMVRMNLPKDKVHDMVEQFKMATWLAKEITKEFKAPNDLEFEVCLYTILRNYKMLYYSYYNYFLVHYIN